MDPIPPPPSPPPPPPTSLGSNKSDQDGAPSHIALPSQEARGKSLSHHGECWSLWVHMVSKLNLEHEPPHLGSITNKERKLNRMAPMNHNLRTENIVCDSAVLVLPAFPYRTKKKARRVGKEKGPSSASSGKGKKHKAASSVDKVMKGQKRKAASSVDVVLNGKKRQGRKRKGTSVDAVMNGHPVFTGSVNKSNVTNNEGHTQEEEQRGTMQLQEANAIEVTRERIDEAAAEEPIDNNIANGAGEIAAMELGSAQEVAAEELGGARKTAQGAQEIAAAVVEPGGAQQIAAVEPPIDDGIFEFALQNNIVDLD
ncbi:hypothetical protein ACP70R_003463 [Stipagrostis hirtigluma subsp. patula]